MPQTFALNAAVELAVVERSGFVESRHAGSAIVLAANGTVLRELGDTAAPVLPRSTLKPLQALACLTAGAPLSGAQLAVATASHAGTDRHADLVRDILAAAGMTEDELGCPPAWPADRATRDELVRDRVAPSRIRHECSGKHAAMLSACHANGWDADGYLEPAHPLQQHVLQVVERMTGEKPSLVAVDGCGAPIPAVSLAGLARALHRMGTASERSPFALHRQGAAVLQAVRAEPWALEGEGRPDTSVIERTGAFVKTGAEGMTVAIAPDGTTAAVKVLDGSSRAARAVALHLLATADALPSDALAAASKALRLAVTGGGAVVGAVRAVV